MIIGFIILMFYYLTYGMIMLLPSGSLFDTTIVAAIAALVDPLSKVAWFLPVAPMLQVLVWSVALQVVLFVVKSSWWVIGLIRGMGMRV